MTSDGCRQLGHAAPLCGGKNKIPLGLRSASPLGAEQHAVRGALKGACAPTAAGGPSPVAPLTLLSCSCSPGAGGVSASTSLLLVACCCPVLPPQPSAAHRAASCPTAARSKHLPWCRCLTANRDLLRRFPTSKWALDAFREGVEAKLCYREQ